MPPHNARPSPLYVRTRALVKRRLEPRHLRIGIDMHPCTCCKSAAPSSAPRGARSDGSQKSEAALQRLSDAPGKPRQSSETLEAMGCVGITPPHRRQLLRILSGLLHLGNVALEPRRDADGSRGGYVDGCDITEGSGAAALERACKLLRVPPGAFSQALCEKRIDARGDSLKYLDLALAATIF